MSDLLEWDGLFDWEDDLLLIIIIFFMIILLFILLFWVLKWFFGFKLCYLRNLVCM